MYQAAFGVELGYHVWNEDRTYFHAGLYQQGEADLAVAESGEALSAAIENPVQLVFIIQDRDELSRAFGVLREGGRVR